jgi:uncharacterized protein (TIGR02996 family)
MSDDAAFIRAILEDPADDAPRLVYADWLDEHGQSERAEFVRIQCDQAYVGLPKRGLTKRELDHLSAPGFDWTEQAAKDIGVACAKLRWDGHDSFSWQWDGEWSVTWSRGFVASIALPTAAFIEHAAELFRAHPITAVRLTDREPNNYGPPDDDMQFGWLSEHEHGVGPAGLPRGLLAALADSEPGDGILRWRNADAANFALSRACVSFGRKAAGLPSLKPAPARRPELPSPAT